MTAQQLALRLAKYIGLTSLDPADPSNTAGPLKIGLVDGDVDELVTAINGALQEIWEYVPASVRGRRVGAVLRGPTSVTVSVTQYSKTVVITGFESWMVGCSIRLAGDSTDNEVVSGTELLREHLGGTASGVPATVFHDCVTLAADVDEVVGPVEIPQVRRLEFAGSRVEFYQYDRGQIGGDDYGQLWRKMQATIKETGQPWAYFLDSDYLASVGMTLRMRLVPMPDTPYPLAYGVKLGPPVITKADLGTSSDPGKTFPLPPGWDESVLLPMALQRFSAHPAFGTGNPLAAQEVARQYAAARTKARQHRRGSESNRMIGVFR